MFEWIPQEAAKADGARGLVVLRDPDRDRVLDSCLKDVLWPMVRKELEQAGHPFNPVAEPHVEPISEGEIARQLTFQQLDVEGRMFSRCEVTLQMSRWTVESSYYLGLSHRQDTEVLFEILGNSRFVGNPPSLQISKEHVGLDGFSQVKFKHGSGHGGGLVDARPTFERVRQIIQIHSRMRALSVHGIIGRDEYAEFVSAAYAVYEAY